MEGAIVVSDHLLGRLLLQPLPHLFPLLLVMAPSGSLENHLPPAFSQRVGFVVMSKDEHLLTTLRREEKWQVTGGGETWKKERRGSPMGLWLVKLQRCHSHVKTGGPLNPIKVFFMFLRWKPFLHSEFDQSWVFVMVVCICASVGSVCLKEVKSLCLTLISMWFRTKIACQLEGGHESET